MHIHRSPLTHRGWAVRLSGYMLAFSALFTGAAVFAQDPEKNLFESINTSTQQGGKVVVRVNFKAPLSSIPAGFTVANPARIALDLPNTANGLGKSTVDVGEGDVRSISVVEVANRTRMVLNLSRNLNYTAALDGNSLVLTVDAAISAAAKDNAQTVKFADPSPAARTQKQSIRDVDFR